MKKQFRTVFHVSCMDVPAILVSAGKIGLQMEVAPSDLIALIGAQTEDIVK